jgi:putative toxin-antitoxin system antitoxin component (TIGR02293 family)
MIAIKNDNPVKTYTRYRKYFEDDVILSSTAHKGLKPAAVFDFMDLSKLPGIRVEHLLNKSIKTFNSYKVNNTVLDATTSEKLLKLFALYDKGQLIFGSAEELNKWLNEPVIGLGGGVPATLLDTITGIELVTQELIRIEYGDLA